MTRIATVEIDGTEHVAVSEGERWIDATRAADHFGQAAAATSTLALVRAGLLNADFCARVCEVARDRPDCVIAGTPRFCVPIRPTKIVAIGRNYKAHVAEFDNQMPTEPVFFAKSVTACIPDGAPIEIRDWYGRVDHEGELAFVIGKRAKDVQAEEGRSYVAAYTIVNDVTARTMQKADAGQGNPWFRAKNFDTFCPLGPVLALPESLGWPVEAGIEVRVNGELRQDGNTRDFIFPIGEVIAGVSRHMTLEPGDIISTGTPDGVSAIKDGDVIEVKIPGIGTLRNPVVGR